MVNPVPLKEKKSFNQPLLARVNTLVEHPLAVNLLLISTGLFLFAPRLMLELKLDELGSFWVIKDSFYDVIERSLHLGQSPFYYLILWGTNKILGSSEVALRLPSLIFTVSSALLMVKLGALFFSRAVGVSSAFVFIGSVQAIVAATDARPYALGILMTIVSTILLMSWIRSAYKSSLVLYSISVAATIYSHYLFAVIAPLHLILITINEQKVTWASFKQLIFATLITLILITPGLYHIQKFSANTAGKAYASIPTVGDLIISLVPREIVVLIGLIAVFQLTIWRGSSDQNRLSLAIYSLKQTSFKKLLTLLLLLTIPVSVIFAVSILSGHSIFLERYFAQRFMGLGLLGGIALCIVPRPPRRYVILAVWILLVATNQYRYGFSEKAGDGFGKATKRINLEDQGGQCELLIMSGFIESQTMSWLSGGLTRGFILSPLSYYTVKNPVTPIPYSLQTTEAQEYYAKFVKVAIERANCIWVLFRNVELFVADELLEPSQITLEKELTEKFDFRASEPSSHGFVAVVGYR